MITAYTTEWFRNRGPVSILYHNMVKYIFSQKENMELLTNASQLAGSRWAWLRLGLYYLSIDDPVQAVGTLRVAVRLDTSDK